MDLQSRILAFSSLGEYIRDFLAGQISDPELEAKLLKAEKENPWFTRPSLEHALGSIGALLQQPALEEWCKRYPGHTFQPSEVRTVGTVMAGNIPLVGFHDFLSILISGHRFAGKLSAKDKLLLPFLAEKLLAIDARLAPFIRFEEAQLKNFDAMIATGSDNATRYFKYYFGKYPHIFRKNRNGIAILTGEEDEIALQALADDVFLYFGLGCRNVSQLFVPEAYDFHALFQGMEKFKNITAHHKYANNYQYHRSVWLMNQVRHLDNGFLLLREEASTSSAVATLHYQTYDDMPGLNRRLQSMEKDIQCIVSITELDLQTIQPGHTQQPALWDYADGVDTMVFLSNLC